MLAKIGDALGKTITAHDSEACHRVPARSASARSDASDNQDSSVNSNIVVSFNRRVKRDALMAKAKRTQINMKDLGFATKQQVYINEHLCPQLKKLLGLTIARKRAELTICMDQGWHGVRSKNRHISCYPDNQ